MNRGINLEMDFPKGLSAVLIWIAIAAASDHPRGFFADNLGAFLGFVINDDLIGTVNLVVGEDAVLEDEPSRSPSFAVIDPLVEYPGDSVPDEVVDLHVHHHRRLLPLARPTAVLAVVDAVAVAVAGSRIRSNGSGGGGRRHGEVGERSGRRFHWGGLVRNGGDAAERMHVAGMFCFSARERVRIRRR